MNNEEKIEIDDMMMIMISGSDLTDYYLGKIDNKNIILTLRATYEITDDEPSALDSHGFKLLRYLKDNNIIGDKEEAINITLVSEVYSSFYNGTKTKVISLAHILYISDIKNIKKTINKEYVLNILEGKEIFCQNMITYVDGEYHIFRKEKGFYDIGDIDKTFLKKLKDTKRVVFSHYVYK